MTRLLIVLLEVGAEIAPPTFSVPATTVFPFVELTVNLFVLTRKSPLTANVPPIVALLVTLSPVPAAVNRDDPEKVLVDDPV